VCAASADLAIAPCPGRAVVVSVKPGDALVWFELADPGTRYWFGTRFGSPALVVSSSPVCHSDSAALHPASDTLLHSCATARSCGASFVSCDEAAPSSSSGSSSLNQRESTDWYIGNRRVGTSSSNAAASAVPSAACC